jgi:hypothetical protein
LPGDDDAVVVPCGDSGPVAAGGSESDEGCFYPTQQGQAHHGLLDQPTIWPSLQAHGGGMIPREHCYDGTNMVMQPAYDPQPQYTVGNGAVHLGGYQQQMPSYVDGNYHARPAPPAYFQPHNAIGLPWNGAFQHDGGSSSSHVGTSSSWMQPPSNGNFNNGAVHDLATTWSPAESSNALAVYPYMHTSGNPPRAQYPHQFPGDNNFPDAPAEFLSMGGGGNGMNYQLGGYETRGSSNNLHYSGASQNSSSNDLFGYGSDD